MRSFTVERRRRPIDGEDGADTLAGGDGRDSISEGAGSGVLNGDAGDDTLSGDAGDDTLHSGLGVDRLSGGEGNDTFIVIDGSTIVDGGDGFDELWLVPISAAAANLSYASFTAQGGSFTGVEATAIFGDVNADTLVGGDLPDTLEGLGR